MPHFMYSIGVLLFLSSLLGCSSLKTASVSFPTDDANVEYLTVKHDALTLLLFGDYMIHPMKEKVTMNWDEAFLDAILKDGNPKPELLFASHTYLQPHCTLISTFYPNLTDATSNAFTYFNTHAMSLKKERKNIGGNDYDIVSYDLLDADINVFIFHIDYFLNTSQGVYRFSFWSTDRDRKWLFRESTAVLEHVELES